MIMTPLHLNNKKSVIYFFPSFQRVSLSQTREHNSTLFVKYRFCCLYFYMKQKLPITNPSKRSALSHTDAFIHSHIQCTYSCPPGIVQQITNWQITHGSFCTPENMLHFFISLFIAKKHTHKHSHSRCTCSVCVYGCEWIYVAIHEYEYFMELNVENFTVWFLCIFKIVHNSWQGGGEQRKNNSL